MTLSNSIFEFNLRRYTMAAGVKHVEVVRNKAERSLLPSFTCEAGLHVIPPKTSIYPLHVSRVEFALVRSL